jgi:hypothetical protein
MTAKRLIRSLLPPAILLVLAGGLAPPPALAVQGHGHPEGIYVHQAAHVFFAAAMGLLIYWLRERRLVAARGWRLIQYSALGFILWNADAFFAHLVDEQLAVVKVVMVDRGTLRVDAPGGGAALAGLYYAAKLDHLLCVPAMAFLYAGLRRLLKDGAPPPPPPPEATGR